MPARHALTLDMIGIPIGATLTFVDKPDVECLVVSLDPPKLLYHEKVYKMSPLVTKVFELPPDSAPQPAHKFVYEGKTLAERRDEFEKYHTHHLE